MNDISDKLRMQADVADAFPMLRAKDFAMTNWVREAADEIERLRAELQLAHSQIAMMATAKVEEEPF